MALKGQNFRICIYDTTASKFKVIGMATGCSVNLTNNTEEASTKDDVGLSSKPTTASKSWTVSCDSLNVADTAAMLTAIKSMQPMTIMWDQTATTDNQSVTTAGMAYGRKGSAYISDVTFNFNDRENSTKALQFTGTGALESLTNADVTQVIPLGSYTKGQNVRLFLSQNNLANPSAVISAAKSLSLHVSVSMENATTKDTTGDWEVMEPTAITYDISTSALVSGGQTITSEVPGMNMGNVMQYLYDSGTPVKWKIANVSGDNNRTADSTIVSGSALLTQLSINGPNRQNADYTAQLAGYGEYTVAA